MKAILFDLDNTLYGEKTYVESGFKEISRYLAQHFNLDFEEVYCKTLEIFNKEGRGKVFDLLLKEYDLNSDKNIMTLVYAYRNHLPEISLYEGTQDVLAKLKKNHKLGLITDGQVIAQKRKVEALNLEKYFDTIIFTDILGSEFWKPSKMPYLIALNNLKSSPQEAIYIGDDPYKDFKAPKELEMKTIQIKKEDEMDYWKKRGYERFEADKTINNLEEILEVI